jgi:hypothetical protein
VSFKQDKDSWEEPVRVDLEMDNVSMPRLSPNGKYLFFTHVKERLQGDIYWVDAKVIENVRPH